jgi:hypothetical protein
MNNKIRELSMNELDLVSGGDIITKAVEKAIDAGIDWLRTNIIGNLAPDVQYNTTGRGDNNGCTGNKC